MRALWVGFVASIVVELAACSRSNDGATANAATSAAPPATTRRAACAMVTAAEMSSFVGTTVTAASEDGSSMTCRYKPAERSTPFVEITIDRGGGRAAMSAAGMLSRHEPGIADPLAGLGDEASAIGPALWVRVGDDLVNLTLWGVDEEVAVAKRIVGTMRPRMGQARPTTR